MATIPSPPTPTFSRRRRVAAGLIVALAIGLGGCRTAPDTATTSPATPSKPASTTSAPKASSILAAQPFVVDAVDQHWLADGPANLGDTVQVNAVVLNGGGVQIGSEGYTCTVVGDAATDAELECSLTMVTNDGTLQSGGLVRRSQVETPGAQFDGPVLGGTGAYRDLRGVIHWTINPTPSGALGEAAGTLDAA
jgi:hypothetical protein